MLDPERPERGFAFEPTLREIIKKKVYDNAVSCDLPVMTERDGYGGCATLSGEARTACEAIDAVHRYWNGLDGRDGWSYDHRVSPPTPTNASFTARVSTSGTRSPRCTDDGSPTGWSGSSAHFEVGWVTNDIVAHEFGHAYNNDEVSLFETPWLHYPPYHAAAIDEHLGDVYGFAIDTADWIIGEDGTCGPLRRADQPSLISSTCLGPRPYPDDYGVMNEGSTPTAGGTPHQRGTVLDHGIYLLADGGTWQGVPVRSVGRATALGLSYFATQQMVDRPRFADYHRALLAAAITRYGFGSRQHVNVNRAMHAVGLLFDAGYIDGLTVRAPAAAVHPTTGTLYLIQVTNTTVDCRTRPTGGSWSSRTSIPGLDPATIDGEVSLALTPAAWWVAYRQTSTGDVYVRRFAGGSWTPEVRVVTGPTIGSPSITASGSAVILGFTRSDGGLELRWSSDGVLWLPERPTLGSAVGATSGPSVIAYNGRIWVFFDTIPVGAVHRLSYIWRTASGGAWSGPFDFPGLPTQGAPALAVFGGNLQVWSRNVEDAVVQFHVPASNVPSDWQYREVLSRTAPVLAPFDGNLLGFASPGSGALWSRGRRTAR